MLAKRLPASDHDAHTDPRADAFARTMPQRYRERFDAVQIALHAGIAARRGDAPTHVERFDARDADGAALCVVGDDRPGLLSLISAALVAHALDVIAAEAYCRTRKGGVEAIDFFWVRRAGGTPGALEDDEVARIGDVLDALVRGKAGFDAVARFAAQLRRRGPGGETRVRFEPGGDAGLAVLRVEAGDRPGLLLAISAALFRMRVQIVRSEIRTESGRAVDRFHLAEFDGAPLRRGRHLQVQVEILTAIDALWRA